MGKSSHRATTRPRHPNGPKPPKAQSAAPTPKHPNRFEWEENERASRWRLRRPTGTLRTYSRDAGDATALASRRNRERGDVGGRTSSAKSPTELVPAAPPKWSPEVPGRR